MVGDPVGHSLSPTIHTAALEVLGIAGTYTARNVDRAGLEAVVDELVAGDLDGVNITMPHKRLAARLVARVTAMAARTGAVNTVTRVGGEAVGHNTDVAGVRLAWGWAGLPLDRPVVVVGSGGAAAAALVAVAGMGVVGPVTVLARSAAAAAAMVGEVAVPTAVAPIGT
ncbi:MAG: shikimate dehydrogenase, partial [Acidimicrobiia bacterium]|nr:shikimate dehydrogenase [Acidimicrobiia bacterium]